MDSHRLKITSSGLANGWVRVSACGRDFFPHDAFGEPTREGRVGKPITIHAVGLSDPIQTDLPTDRAGRPRGFFRDRSWFRRFAEVHKLAADDEVIITRLGGREYRVEAPSRSGSAPKFAEFFAGIGLMRMGLERAGWQIAFANDIDPMKRGMYDAHFRDADDHFVLGDIHELSADSVPTVELATASFPCTDLSLAGGRRGLEGPQSSAFWGFCRILEQMKNRRPPLVLIENVTGFLTSNGGNDFHSALIRLNELGYAIDAFMLDAKWFVPQSRPRLFLLASQLRKGSTLDLAPESRTRSGKLAEFIFQARDVHWQFHNAPDPPLAPRRQLCDIVEDLPPESQEWWNKDRRTYFYNQISPRHRPVVEQLIAKRRWTYATAFRRVRPAGDGTKRSIAELRFDGLAGCLRTPKGGSGRQILLKAGYRGYAVRLLTPRECARLMGADGFRISGSLNEALFGFGDAVCVPAISWIAQNVITPSLKSENG